MAALLENDAKHILARSGVRVPLGRVCSSPDEVRRAVDEIGAPVAVKALIPSKGKQVAGGIEFAQSAADAVRVAARMLGATIAGFEVCNVLVEVREDIVAEIYVAVQLHGPTKAFRLTVARKGGVNVEAALARGAGHVLDFHVHAPPWPHQVRALLLRCGVRGDELRQVPDAIVGICRAALDIDATLLEVNPLGVLADATACAIGVLVSVDESALYRHPDLAQRAVQRVDQLLRPLTAWERRINEVNDAIRDGGDVRFAEFPDGDIGMMVLGGGAGLVALDAVARAGGRPANFFDMTSSAGGAEEKIYRITKVFLGVERLRGLFVGSNIGAFLPVPIRLRGIARALREDLQARGRFPVVIRLAGIGDDDVLPILDGLPVIYFRDDATLEHAADVFMRELDLAA